MDCTTDFEGRGGSARALASQAAFVRAFGAVTAAFGIVELGLGTFLCLNFWASS